MTQEWYLKRINNLDVNSIRNLDYKSLARLTCGFNPLFVGKLILRGLNVGQQRLILQHINNKYITWKRELNPKNEPAFYQKLYDYVELSIKCGMMFRPEELDKFISDAGINTITGVKKPETTAAFEERIKELEEKNKRLYSENKELKEKHPSADDHDEIDGLKEEIEHLKTETGKLTSKEAAILTITACYHAGGLPPNRENLYPILTNLFGVGESLAKRRLREGINEKDVESLAKCFDEVSPVIARTLREMPEKLKNKKKK